MPNDEIIQSKVESTVLKFDVQELYRAQQRSWDALVKLRECIQPGISEVQAVSLIAAKLKELGSPHSWHHPVFRIGENSTKPYHHPASEQRILSENDLFYIDIGPTWVGKDGIEYEGDVGQAYTFVPNPEHQKCIDTAKALFDQACDYWRNADVSGAEIYAWLAREASARGYSAVVEDNGHRIGDFPHKRVFNGSLAEAEFKPSSGLWVLEVHIAEPQQRFGAFFEDILK